MFSGRSRLLAGLACLFGVVVIWVASSNIIQMIFIDDHFNNSFFLTYFNTGLFTIYLVYWPCYKRNLRETAEASHRKGLPPGEVCEVDEDDDGVVSAVYAEVDTPITVASAVERRTMITASGSHYQRAKRGPGLSRKHKKRKPSDAESAVLRPFTVRETVIFALQFAPLWFFANFTFNLSLSLTSVSSNTIISSTSGLFTFLIGVLARKSNFSILVLLGILVAFGGVILIQVSDSESASARSAAGHACNSTLSLPSSSASHASSFSSSPGFNASSSPASDTPHSVSGDLICLLSAASYGLYANVLKWKIDHEDRISNPIFLGFVGLWNLVLLWPGVLLLHFTGLQRLTVPSGDTIAQLLLNGLIGTVASDLLWLYAVLLASPMIATLGTSFTIPLALVVDWMFKGARFGVEYVFGGLLVLVGFAFATLSEHGIISLDRLRKKPSFI